MAKSVAVGDDSSEDWVTIELTIERRTLQIGGGFGHVNTGGEGDTHCGDSFKRPNVMWNSRNGRTSLLVQSNGATGRW